MADAERVVRAIHDHADRVVVLMDDHGTSVVRQLVRDLRDADRRLRARLLVLEAKDSFSAAHLRVFREHAQAAIRHVEGRLDAITLSSVTHGAVEGVRSTGEAISRLDAVLAVAPAEGLVPLRASALLQKRALGAVIRRFPASIARYGTAMTEVFERELRLGLLSGSTVGQMTDRLVRAGDGLFVGHRGWAERIVRTETAAAFNSSRMMALRDAAASIPDLQKKILAQLDGKTALDSVVVHGQVRDLDGYFQDGAGRVYQQPPARPNDREIVIPWRPGWRDIGYTRRVPPSRIARARTAEHPGLASRPRARRAA